MHIAVHALLILLTTSAYSSHMTFQEYRLLVENLTIQGRNENISPQDKRLQATPLKEALGACIDMQRGKLFSRAWLATRDERYLLAAWKERLRTKEARTRVPTYVKKKIAPKGAQYIFFGDLHGGVHSLLACLKKLQKQGILNGWTIRKPDTHIVFLGDYTDRGWYGRETLYGVLMLALHNQKQVTLVRGNHEDYEINKRYGFAAELKTLPASENLTNLLKHFYDTLPAALFLGIKEDSERKTRYIQCCHGGIEPRANFSQLFINDSVQLQLLRLREENRMMDHVHSTEIRQRLKTAANEDKEEKEKEPRLLRPTANGLMWGDFLPSGNEILTRFGSRWALGKQTTKALLQAQKRISQDGWKHKITAIFRAHQHTDTMKPWINKGNIEGSNIRHNPLYGHKEDRGIAKLWAPSQHRAKEVWEELICTFSVAADSEFFYEGFPIAYGELTLREPRPEKWELESHIVKPKWQQPMDFS